MYYTALSGECQGVIPRKAKIMTTVYPHEHLALIAQAKAALEARKDRSAWDKGVTDYAFDMLYHWEENAQWYKEKTDLESLILNGAKNWNEYSWGGCSLCDNYQIAARLCTPSELKKTNNGQRRPNSREEWLDTQARACRQAFRRIAEALEM